MQEHTKTKSRQRQKHKNTKQTNIMQQLHTNTIQQIYKSTKQQRLTVKLRPAQEYNAIAIVKGIRFSEEHATM